jgi:hypothetical protein
MAEDLGYLLLPASLRIVDPAIPANAIERGREDE